MQPKGRIAVFVQSNWAGSTFLNFILALMLPILSWVQEFLHEPGLHTAIASHDSRL
jgi:hypothetical protein